MTNLKNVLNYKCRTLGNCGTNSVVGNFLFCFVLFLFLLGDYLQGDCMEVICMECQEGDYL